MFKMDSVSREYGKAFVFLSTFEKVKKGKKRHAEFFGNFPFRREQCLKWTAFLESTEKLLFFSLLSGKLKKGKKKAP
jgi:hypothetical protein